LGKTKDPSAADAVVEYLHSAESQSKNFAIDEFNVVRLLESLGALKDSRTIEYIRPFLNRKERASVILAATEALLSMGEEIPDDLIITLHGLDDYSVNKRAWEILANIGDEDTILKLKKNCPDNLSGWHLKLILPVIQAKCMIYNPAL